MEQSQIINCLMERDQYLFNRFKLISIEFVFYRGETYFEYHKCSTDEGKN